MDEKRDSFAAQPNQTTNNQGLLGGRDNPGYGCIIEPPPAFNPTCIYSNPVTVQPGFQGNQQLHNVRVVHSAPVVVHGTFPPSYWGLALFSLLCCFWPFGVLAFVYSYRTNDAIKYGNLDLAGYYSRKSKIFSLWSIGIGLCCAIAIAIVFLV